MNKKAVFILLLVIALLGRVIRIGPNIEFVTAGLILSSMFLGRKYAIFFVLIVMLFSDIIIGNTNIFLFTWSGFLIPAILAAGILNKLKLNKLILGTGLGLTSNIFFYLWTNFGVWALDSWGMYEKSVSGLIRCYINGLPFLKYQMFSTLLALPLGFILVKMLLKYVAKENRATASCY
jgi:hypothetical protein